MTISVKVKPKAKSEGVRVIDAKHFEVSVKEPPDEGRANRAVIRLIADHFGVARSRVQIISGAGHRQKILEIN